MNAVLGSTGVFLAFLSALCGAGALAWQLTGSRVRSADPVRAMRLGVAGLLAGVLLATAAMEHALVTHDFSLAYVAGNSSRETPGLYVVTGMWSALAGSILLWGLILALYLTAVAWIYRRRQDQITLGWVMLVGLVTAAFFFGLMVGPSNPFATLHVAPHDGIGPNPLLQDRPLVAFHPPLLYTGLVGFTVPFGFAVAGLVTGDLGTRWAGEVRRWTLFSWGCLGGGIVLGMWWSYQVLGWGGFWGWDPVENAAFVPWLVATAFLHSVVAHEQRAILRVWNSSLVSAAFCLSILCTFLTRSGVLESVHAFSNSSIGPFLIAFFGVCVVGSVALVAWRGDLLRSPLNIESVVSREGAFLANNVALSVFAFVVLLGTVFPLVMEAVSGRQVTVGSPYFDTMTMPIVIALLFLMAVAPVLPWRRSSVETAARRLLVPATATTLLLIVCVAAGVRSLAPLTAYLLATFAGTSALRVVVLEVRSGGIRALAGRTGGGMVVHIGVVIAAVGMATSLAYGHRAELSLRPGQVTTFDGHTVGYTGVRAVRYPNRSSVEATVVIDGTHTARPALSVFNASGPAIGTPAVDSGLADDVYVTLVMSPSTVGGAATIGVVVQPLVAWLWVGGAVVAAGAVLALADMPRRRRGRKGGHIVRTDIESPDDKLPEPADPVSPPPRTPVP